MEASMASIELPWKRPRHGSVEASVEASVEVPSTEFLHGSFHGSYFHGGFRESFHGSYFHGSASTKVTPTEAKLSWKYIASTEAFTEAFTKANFPWK